MLTRLGIICGIRMRPHRPADTRVERSMRRDLRSIHPGRASVHTVAVSHFGLAHEAGAADRADGRARAELHAGLAREGNLRADGSHVGGDGRHDIGLVANVSGSNSRVVR